MTQKQLSELTGIRRNAINEWYNEITVSLKVEHIDRICEVLGCSVEELIEYIPNKVPKTGKYLIVELKDTTVTSREINIRIRTATRYPARKTKVRYTR